MKTKSVFHSAAFTILFLAFKTSIVFGQASPAELQNFPMPPTNGYELNKELAYVGDYSYTVEQNYADSSNFNQDEDYAYFRFTGIAYKKIYIQPRFYNADIVPPAANGTDACPHTHMSYGLWIKYEFNPYVYGYNYSVPQSYYQFFGGGGMSGVRNSKGNCVHKVDNPLASFDSRFGWGSEFSKIVPAYLAYVQSSNGPIFYVPTELIVGVSAPTHGWGTCKTFGCYEPVGLNVWTLAW